jgi:hypothetical protein
MDSPRTRRVQRVRLAQPIVAKLGSVQVVLVDLSVLGARIEHHVPLHAGTYSRFAFRWDGEEVSVEARIVRSRLERFSVGTDGLTVYHSGLEFENVSRPALQLIKTMIGTFIQRALEEQKLNARGILPLHDASRMPIFRLGGQLASNARDRQVGAAALPTSRVARETGYVCCQFENDRWRKKRTHDPGQPTRGFTVSAEEDAKQVDLLCEAWQLSDENGRQMIQLLAQLSIAGSEAEDQAGRYEV